jgi:rhodanese-related sulfurtransferase
VRCLFRWPTWPPGEVRGWPTLAAFVPPLAISAPPLPTDPDPEADAIGYVMPILRSFSWDEVAPGVHAGRAPIFRRDVWRLRARGITHILDLRETLEWDEPGRRGGSAIAEIDVVGLNRLQVAIRDMGTPSAAHLDESVAYLDAALHLGGQVYVHCRAGVQRTAAIAASWYARQQRCSVNEAIEQLRVRRPDFEPLVYQLRAAQSWLAQQRQPD